ncbi:MAG: hypothetical protein GXC78_00715 [Chitinophagaceae bacterium]|nr:hypothetical protein [Chitinophagaceae bacterium]
MQKDFKQLRDKVTTYQEVLANTHRYRQEWKDHTRDFIRTSLTQIIDETGLRARITERTQIENLEAVVLDLGRSSSGLSENLENTDLKHTMVKNNGSLIYQQLFNGKIMVMLTNPYIEGYGEPKPARSLEIVRPEELTPTLIYAHTEQLLNDLIEWEDFDDDDHGRKPAFQPIGFQHSLGNGENR